MSQKPTLLVLAAGMGSRYGGVKQIEPLGPNGEIILEYSLYDALRAGFGDAVFVIRRDIEEDVRTHVLPKFEGKIPVTLVFQDHDDLPDGHKVPEGRVKPWGTAHAVLAARHTIDKPFAVVNADDYYGPHAYRVMAEHLTSIDPSNSDYSLVGYRLSQVVSENGSVSRGVCQVDEKGYLSGIEEHKTIEVIDGSYISRWPQGDRQLSADDSISMNLFGFTPKVFSQSMDMFKKWLPEHKEEPKSEFFIPVVSDTLIKSGEGSFKVLPTDEKWFGVTYAADSPVVKSSLAGLHQKGTYPQKLWD